jgi:predicted MPP superfamily phosphohydrolase
MYNHLISLGGYTLKIILTSDTHINITSRKSLHEMFERIASEEFDVLVHGGDLTGGSKGYKSVNETLDIMRLHLPDAKIVSTIGNHDYYSKKHPPESAFDRNYEKIVQSFRDHNVHFLDEDGVFIHDDFPLVKMVGCSLWYSNNNPPTIDSQYLPRFAGETHRTMYSKTYKKLIKNLDELDETYSDIDTVIFVSHFPVILGGDSEQGFAQFGGSPGIGDMMQEQYNCRYFLNGHAHQNWSGPLRWESGSDYYYPKYKFIEVI